MIIPLRIAPRISLLLIFAVIFPMLVSAQSEEVSQPLPKPVAALATDIQIYNIAWSPDGELIAATTQIGTLILDQNLAIVRKLRGHHSERSVGVAWRPDGSQLATGGSQTDSSIVIWDRDMTTNHFTFNRRLPTRRGSVSVLAWSPDGQRLASLSMSSVSNGLLGELNLWGTVGNWERSLKPEYVYADPLFVLTWSFDGHLLALHSRLECLPQLPSGPCTLAGQEGTVVIDAALGEVAYVNRNPPTPFSLAWSPVKLELASTGNMDIEFYDVTGKLIRGLATSISELNWSPGGAKLAGEFANEIYVLDVNSDNILNRYPFFEARSIQWSPDGSRIAAANLDGLIQVWQIGTPASP
jgi:WD40 repeat protein